MNLLDENIPEAQCQLLRKWRYRFRQIGQGIGRLGMQDNEIIVLLHDLLSPTFFTRDSDFFESSLGHAGYCLVYADVMRTEFALFARRMLKHPDFNSKSKRMGAVIRISHQGLTVWRLHAEHGELLDDFEAAGAFSACPAGAERRVLRWMIEAYLGVPGRHGTWGRNRAVFFSDTAAPRIEAAIGTAPPQVRAVLVLIVQEAAIRNLVTIPEQQERLDQLCVIAARENPD